LKLVSIILPTFNRADLLPRAINSVLAQTYPHWELIIWDDGSMDKTEEIVRSYKDGRLKYFYDDNHGVAYACNRAIEASHGKYLAFLDSDDEWSEDILADHVEAMNAYPDIDVLFSDFININAATGEEHRTFEQYSGAMKFLDVNRVNDNLYLVRERLLEGLAIANFIATDTIMVHREVLEKIGFFIEELRKLASFELCWRMGLAGTHFAYQDKVHLKRFKQTDSLSNASIWSSNYTIKALNFCYQETLSKRRADLIPYLNRPLRNAWMNMIPLYGNIRDKKGMFNAFYQSMKYGFSWGAIHLLVESALLASKDSGGKKNG
jgi:glycosyltransferase involved in cell wall biosynthesis